MKKFSIFGVTALLVMLIMASCTIKPLGKEDQEIETKEYNNLKAFDVINVESDVDIKVIYTPGDTTMVKVKAPKDILECLAINSKDGILHIGNTDCECANEESGLHIEDKKIIFKGSTENIKVKVYVTTPQLRALTLNNTSSFVCKEKMEADKLILNVIGTCDLDIAEVSVDDLKMCISGTASANIKELKAITTSYKIHGVAAVNIKEKDVANTKLQVEGTASVEMDFDNCDEASVYTQGVSNIKLTGSLNKLNKNTEGLGQIDTKGLKAPL